MANNDVHYNKCVSKRNSKKRECAMKRADEESNVLPVSRDFLVFINFSFF